MINKGNYSSTIKKNKTAAWNWSNVSPHWNAKWQEDLYTLIQPSSFDTLSHGPSLMIIFICDEAAVSRGSVFMWEAPQLRGACSRETPGEWRSSRSGGQVGGVIKRAGLIPSSEDTAFCRTVGYWWLESKLHLSLLRVTFAWAPCRAICFCNCQKIKMSSSTRGWTRCLSETSSLDVHVSKGVFGLWETELKAIAVGDLRMILDATHL